MLEPSGEPTTLGEANWAELGTTFSRFAPDGKSWLYFKGRNIYLRPLPAGTESDRLFDRLGADVVDIRVSTDPDQLIVAEKSGDTHVWSFPRDGLPRETIIPRPDTASFGMFPDPSGRWLSYNDTNADAQVRLWDVTSWRSARPLTLRRRTSWLGAMMSFDPQGQWVVASTGNFTNLTFWPLGRSCPVEVDGYKGLARPLAFSPDSNWLVTDWGDKRLRLWPLPGSGVSDIPGHWFSPQRPTCIS